MKLINKTMFTEELHLMSLIIPKIAVATICGALVGWERERKNKVAGIRTNILICTGSAIFTIASLYVTEMWGGTDPSRMLSTIVTGIGFLGAGVIMRDHDKIIGLTTAAFIWTISAIGILCGVGLTLTPISLTIGLLIISHLFGKVERWIKRDMDNHENRD